MKHSQLSGENSHLRLSPTLDPKLIVCVTNLFIQSTPVKRNLHRGVCVSTHPISVYVAFSVASQQRGVGDVFKSLAQVMQFSFRGSRVAVDRVGAE